MHLQSSVPPTPSTPAPPVTMFSDTTSVFFRPFPTRWGDLPTIDDDPGIAALERDTVTKPRLMAVESMKPYQPCKPSDDAARLKQVGFCRSYFVLRSNEVERERRFTSVGYRVCKIIQTKQLLFLTRLDTRLPQSRAGGRSHI